MHRNSAPNVVSHQKRLWSFRYCQVCSWEQCSASQERVVAFCHSHPGDGMGWAPQQAAPVALVAVAGVRLLEPLRPGAGLVRYRAAIVIILAARP